MVSLKKSYCSAFFDVFFMKCFIISYSVAMKKHNTVYCILSGEFLSVKSTLSSNLAKGAIDESDPGKIRGPTKTSSTLPRETSGISVVDLRRTWSTSIETIGRVIH